MAPHYSPSILAIPGSFFGSVQGSLMRRGQTYWGMLTSNGPMEQSMGIQLP
jgi:hypothetical protein